MKNFIKNNIFVSIILGFVWSLFLGLSIADSGFFSEHFMQAVGTTIFWITLNASIKARKIERIKQSIRLQENKNIESNVEGTRKKYVANYKYLLKFYGILCGIAAILTVSIFYIRKIELTVYDFLIGILVFSVCELIIGSIVVGIRAYIRECKQEGFLKTTLYVIFMLMIVVWLVISKNSRWF